MKRTETSPLAHLYPPSRNTCSKENQFIDPTVFRAYDIRGRAPGQLTPFLAERLGRAIGTRVMKLGGTGQVALGRDHRPSGQKLIRAMRCGLMRAGCMVIDVGIVPTPVLYWVCQNKDVDAGVMTTGSHLGNDFNGFKIQINHRSIGGEELQALRREMTAGVFSVGTGSVIERSPICGYLRDLEGKIRRATRPLKVVVDAGNATGSLTGPALFRALGHDVTELHCDLGSVKVCHPADPTVDDNLFELRQAVRRLSADLGVAFDGDGDRIVAVDDQGRIVRGDKLLALFSGPVLRDNPGASIIGEVKCSRTLFTHVRRLGGVPIMSKTGHHPIKAAMREISAPLAGEMSGHIFFADRYYGFDDATYAGARLLELLNQSSKSLSQMMDALQTWPHTPELRYPVEEHLKFALRDRVAETLANRYKTRTHMKLITIDGIRVEWPHGWGLLRASNTEAVLVLRFEAQTTHGLHEIQREFNEVLDNCYRSMSMEDAA